jgi:hypothetical protein
MLFAILFAESTTDALSEHGPFWTAFGVMLTLFYNLIRFLEKNHLERENKVAEERAADKKQWEAERADHLEYRGQESHRAHKYAIRAVAAFAKEMNLQIPSKGVKP